MLQQWVLPVTLIGRTSRDGSSQESRVLELGVDKKAGAEVGSVSAWNDDLLLAVGAGDITEVVFETMRATVERLKTEAFSKPEKLLGQRCPSLD
jgi:hypothetical protein